MTPYEVLEVQPDIVSPPLIDNDTKVEPLFTYVVTMLPKASSTVTEGWPVKAPVELELLATPVGCVLKIS
jgi:hypothetical protein